jgi:hypothetical protein
LRRFCNYAKRRPNEYKEKNSMTARAFWVDLYSEHLRKGVDQSRFAL